ncbi:hypothetical protein CDAR_589361 [Caerostris darwini]|uniref:Uncharacterized protein n=1 Tax=Caerostris darwini TaxID=1538125 RepID=A0AAV4T7B4_9ARAC|nr:hypothetical protein CDAR_589361 [Caerostris darwini]
MLGLVDKQLPNRWTRLYKDREPRKLIKKRATVAPTRVPPRRIFFSKESERKARGPPGEARTSLTHKEKAALDFLTFVLCLMRFAADWQRVSFQARDNSNSPTELGDGFVFGCIYKVIEKRLDALQFISDQIVEMNKKCFHCNDQESMKFHFSKFQYEHHWLFRKPQVDSQ